MEAVGSIKPIVLANAATTVAVVGFVLCRVLSYLIPDILFTIAQGWVHTFNLEPIRATIPIRLGLTLLEGVLFAGLIWIATYAVASLYNAWAKEGG
jgi:hypothetical protein